MKALIFAAAIGVSSIALAQTTGTTGTGTTGTMETTDTGTEETTEGQTTGTEGMTQGSTGTMTTDTTATGSMSTGGTMSTDSSMSMQSGAMGGGGTVAPGNTNPERDARGIPVVSDPAQAPAGANAMVSITPGARVVASANQAAAFQTQPSSDTYQACSRTVTDNCVQAYEVGRTRRRR